MTDVGSSVIARIKKQDSNFEVLVDCEKAIAFKAGESTLDEALVTNDIFKDIKKGEHASENLLETIFGTTDKNKVAEIIIKEGEIQLTTGYKGKLREQKRKQIINLIARNSVDPKTNLPHPPQRIENALDEIRVSINEFKSAEEQVQEIVNKIRGILPISYEIKMLAIKIPSQFSGQSYSILKKFGNLIKEDWLSDGSLLITVEVPAGLQNDLFDSLNNLTHGQIEVSEKEKT
jgi:ribosome maturation protein SDO1